MVMRTEFSHGTCGVQNPVQQPPNSRAVGNDRGRAAMRWPPAPVRRLAIGLALLAALVAPGAATLWIWSPDASDIQARVIRLASSNGLTLLGDDEVPALLAHAVVATEDERFYSHHGVDSIGLGRALLYDVVNVCLCQGG
ncbi:MAG: hypothetical protein E6I35_01530, partial [Chloroflexi bacterium]